ncbi:hypothetical protein [Nannocystis pusilla]|uniref:DUF3618 domain-containing protein n=1 Tax=Nannocystis pusilla TaxID=889268 RepID=A0ABS7TMC2_9BACT|nr:hypothetical protein [Nannocystis pusilla]MBZ5709374.1 hypothetical protein [Nannocystis pusilla]
MTDQEFMQRTQERLEQLRGEQRRLHERLATDLRQIHGLRMGLNILAGTLALGLGLSVGYQIGRR